jgi:hypothetical protein
MRLPHLHRRPDAAADLTTWDDGEDQTVVALLERYASESLSPDEATLSRMGGVVRAAFVESVTERETGFGYPAGPLIGPPGGRPHLRWGRRRAAAAFCAVAILTLSTFGFAAAQSGPGQPFYRIRLGIETVNQPPAGSQDRLAADLVRADARLNEIAGSAGGSDWNAAADAASAYRETLTGVTLPTDATSRAQVLKHLNDQLARLEQLRARSKGPATAQLDDAIAALRNLLGIPVPTFSDSTSSDQSPRPTDHDRDSGTAALGQSGGDGGHDHGKSPAPSLPTGSGSPAGSGGASGSSGDDGNGGASQTPRSGGNGGHTPAPTPAPSEGH